MNVNVPEQLAVIGFDDIDFAKFMDITTISQQLDESGRLAAEIFPDHISGSHHDVQHINLPLQLIE